MFRFGCQLLAYLSFGSTISSQIKLLHKFTKEVLGIINGRVGVYIPSFGLPINNFSLRLPELLCF